MKSLAKNSIFNVCYKFISLIFPLITSAYIARILMPAGVGKVTYAQNIASYFMMLASLGIPTYGIKAIAEVRDSKNNLNRTFSSLFVLNFVFTLLSSLAYVVLIYSVSSFRTEIVLYWACGLQVFFTCINIDWLYSGQEEYIYIVLRSLIVKILALLSLFVFVRSKSDYVNYALITSIAMAGNNVFNIVHSRKYVKISFSQLEFKQHLGPIFTIAVLSVLGTLYNKIDVTMLGIYANDDAVGIYSNAHKVIDIIVSTCAAFTAAFLPRLSYYFKNGSDNISSLLNRGVEALSFIVIPSVFGIAAVAPFVTNALFGPSFDRASVTIRVFSIVIFFRAFGDLFCYQLLIASGKEKKRILANLITTGINIGLNAILIPIFLENGAAIASVISEAFVNIYLYIYIKKVVNYQFNYRPIIQAIIGSLIMLIGCIPSYMINCSSALKCILAIAFCSFIYLIVNIAMKNEFTVAIFEKINKLLKQGKNI